VEHGCYITLTFWVPTVVPLLFVAMMVNCPVLLTVKLWRMVFFPLSAGVKTYLH